MVLIMIAELPLRFQGSLVCRVKWAAGEGREHELTEDGNGNNNEIKKILKVECSEFAV